MFISHRVFLFALLTSLTVSSILSSVHAANSNTSADEYEYPELTVTPRATDRLQMEADRENAQKWTANWAITASALTTLTAGIIQDGNSKPNNPNSSMAGIGVGAGWIATSVLLSALYRPFSSGAEEVRALPNQSKRQQLTRERLAEEALYTPSRLATRLMFLSVVTNAAASAYMIGKAQSGSSAITFDGIALAASFLPLVFQSSWRNPARMHEEYKKKIYAPVANAGILLEPVTQNPSPGMTVSLRF